MKSNLDSLFKANKTLEAEGVDFVVQEEDKEKGLKEQSFKVRRFVITNPRQKAAMAAYHKPYARQIQMNTLEPAKQQEILIKVFVDTCLVSWKGVEADGKELECNKENAYELFKSLPDLFDALWAHANDFQNYKEELGNS